MSCLLLRAARRCRAKHKQSLAGTLFQDLHNAVCQDSAYNPHLSSSACSCSLELRCSSSWLSASSSSSCTWACFSCAACSASLACSASALAELAALDAACCLPCSAAVPRAVMSACRDSTLRLSSSFSADSCSQKQANQQTQ